MTNPEIDIGTATVDSPYEKGKRESVEVNKASQVGRRLGLGPAQAEALRCVERLIEGTGEWRNGAVDPSNEPVDCSGSARELLTESRQRAFRRLKRLRKSVGDDFAMIEYAARTPRLTYVSMANTALAKQATKNEVDQFRIAFKVAVNRLARELGLISEPSWTIRLRSHLPDGKRGIDERCWEV